MSAWPGKYVIGLTGNIATGKSVVRRMLEHLGAYGIDADALGHRAIALGAPGYQPVLRSFGTWILAPDGQIDRAKLGRVVFSDPEALARLEAIVHPLVGGAVDLLVQRARQKVVVIEAIKLIESGLREKCDALWVTSAPKEIQLARLIGKRKMSATAARQRIAAQPSQQEKIAVADVVIHNAGTFEETWRQVVSGWPALFPSEEHPSISVAQTKDEMVVQRARPRQSAEIASFISRYNPKERQLSRADIMAAFGEKAYLLLRQADKLVGLVGWQVENLVARTDELYIDPQIPLPKALQILMGEVEHASRELQCEVLLVFLPEEMNAQLSIWQDLGYEVRTVASLGVRAWQEAAVESMPSGSVMLFKQLRKDRVLRPV